MVFRIQQDFFEKGRDDDMVHLVMQEMAAYFGSDVQRINHALKVYGFAGLIGRLEKLSEQSQLVLDCTGLLHDIGILEAEKKHGSTAGVFQQIEGPPIARALLQTCGIDEATIERVCFITAHHHSYQAIDGTDFQILVEADFLVNIFEEEMTRDAIKSVVSKYFKTRSGIELAESMYLK